MAKVPEKMPDGSERRPAMSAFLQAFVDAMDIDQEFIDASDHSHECTCEACKEWWRQAGSDPESGCWGPFGETSP